MPQQRKFPWLHLSLLLLLMMSSLVTQSIVADDTDDATSKHCPSPCECYIENYIPYGRINTIICSDLELIAIPDLTALLGSTIPNNLALNRNEIKEVSKSDFPPGLNIAILNLNANREMKIATNAFLNLGYSLKKLSLEAIDIPYDKTMIIFDGLFSLQELSLDHNNKKSYTQGAVSNVEVPLFQGHVAKVLKKLKLAFCTIRSMTAESLKSLVKLEDLDLSNNFFKSVPPSINVLPNLKILKLFYCRITSLSDNDFSGMPLLQKLDISSNKKLSKISDKAFAGCEESLTELSLQRCALTQVPSKALSNLKKITNLDLSENKFINVEPGSFEGEYKLEKLDISSDTLAFGPNMFKGQETNIKEISIPRMKLKEVPRQAIKSLTNLVQIRLEYNNITVLKKDAFNGIKATSIILTNNPLSYVEQGAFNGLSDEMYINLARTELKTFEFLMGYPESKFHTVNLEHTQLECQCSMKSAVNITQWMQVFGACKYKNVTKYLNSNSLGPLVDQICDEMNASSKVIPTYFGLFALTLILKAYSISGF